MAYETFVGNLRSAPMWMKDFSGRDQLMPFGIKLDPAQFTDQSGAPVTVAAGGAAQGATSIPITALNYASSVIANTVIIAQGNVLIPAGTVLSFGGAKFARTTADAVYGATTLTVAALPTALVAGDTTTYTQYGGKFVPSGTLVGRTFAEQTAATPFGPADTATPDDEIYLTAFDVVNLQVSNDATVYRPTGRVAINYLPGFANFGANDLTQLRRIYQCFTAVD